MLPASYLASCSDDLVRLYSQLEEDIVVSMARRIAKIGRESDSVEWQAKIYSEIGGIQSDINQLLRKYNIEATKEVEDIISNALDKANAKDMTRYNVAKRNMTANQRQMLETMAQKTQSSGIVTGSRKVSEEAINGGTIKVMSGIQRLTQTIAATGQQSFVNAMNRAYLQVNTGAFSYTDAIKQAVTNLASEGLDTIEYTDSGKVIHRTIESAVRSNVLTGVNQQAAQQTLNNCEETDTDLVEVSAHLGARNRDNPDRPWANHEDWQGKVYSLSGKRTYKDADGEEHVAEDFYEICRPGEPDGICGINCRHSYYPYFEGTSLQYTEGELDEYKEATVTLNGKQVSRYEAEQKLRQAERQIRKYKRIYFAQETALVDSTQAQNRLYNWQAVAAKICKETGLRRDYSREFVANKITRNQTVINKKLKPLTKSLDADDFEMMGETKHIDKKIISTVIQTIKKYERAGGVYYNDFSFESLTDANGGKALFQTVVDNDYHVVFKANIDMIQGKTKEEIENLLVNNKGNVVESLEEAVIHENGHARSVYGLSYKEVESLYNEIKDAHIEGISKIAYNDGAEALAEIEVLLSRGEKIPEKALEFYNKYMNRGEK